MKKKSLFRKALSLICCVAMCLTTFIPVIDAATVDSSPSAEMSIPDGITLLAANGKLFVEGTGTVGNVYAYTYSTNEKKISFYATDNSSLLGKTIYFYVVDNNSPKVTSSNEFNCGVKVEETTRQYASTKCWKVTLEFSDFDEGPYTLTCEKGVQTYDVTFQNGECTFMNAGGTATLKSGTFDDGEKIPFTLNGVTDGKKVVIKENSKELSVGTDENAALKKDGNVYTYTVTKDAVITASLEDVTYDVKVPASEEQTGYSLVSADGKYEVAHGGTFTFYVRTIDEKYNAITAANITAKDSKDTPLTVNQVSDTQYTINGIVDDVTIAVATPGVKQYDITLIGGTGSTIEAVNNSALRVDHGGSFEFQVTVDERYNSSTPVISINGTPIAATFNNGVCTCTIENITEAKTVSVSNLTMNTYNVTLTPGAGYTLSPIGSTTVTHGSKFQFRLDLAAGYENPIVKVGEKTITSENGIYTIDGVNDNVVVTVEVKSKTFNVTVYDEQNDHATVTAVDTSVASIPYNGSYLFKVKADPGYSISSVSVNNAVVTPIGDTYTVRNVVDDLTIVVETVENTLTVNYRSTEKNHEYTETEVYTYTELATAKLPELNKCKLHTFMGWSDGSGNYVTSLNDKYKDEVAKANVTVILTAEYVVDTTKLASLLKLEATTDETTKLANNTYRITFRTKVTTEAITDACVTDFVKIIRHGTILANTKDVNFANVNFNGAALPDTGTYNGIQSSDGTNTVYLYYIQCAYSWSEFNSALVAADAKSSIILRVSNVGENEQLYAAGWVEVKVGNETFRIISGVNEVITVENTVDTPAE